MDILSISLLYLKPSKSLALLTWFLPASLFPVPILDSHHHELLGSVRFSQTYQPPSLSPQHQSWT